MDLNVKRGNVKREIVVIILKSFLHFGTFQKSFDMAPIRTIPDMGAVVAWSALGPKDVIACGTSKSFSSVI